jgi:DNA-binding transcriptional MocR family regulator
MLPKRVERSFLYEQVASKITQLISQGTIRPGERVPSVRKISHQQRISISTALQAYFLLENQGLIEARPQSGFYVRTRSLRLPPEPKMTNPPLAATRVGVDELVAKVIEAAGNPAIISLGAGTVSTDLFPNQKLTRLLSSVARRTSLTSNTYDLPPGNGELRRQIARRSLEWGGTLSRDEIVITSGCTEALNLCLRAVAGPGDIIAVESPTYYVLLQIIESLRMKALEIPTHPRDGLGLDALTAAIERKAVRACVIMANHHNPLGSCMPEENKRNLVSILARKEIPLIEDDIYGDLFFGTERPKPAKAFDSRGLVLLCSSFSKTLAPGYRVGWTAPGRFRVAVERLKMVNTMGNPVLPQMMIAEFLQSGGYDHHLRKLRRAYANQVQLMSQAISRSFPEGTKVTRPLGGFVLWVELPASVDSLQLHREALARNISIAPGPIFSANQNYRNFMRLNCGGLWSDRIEQAVAALGQLVTKLARTV